MAPSAQGRLGALSADREQERLLVWERAAGVGAIWRADALLHGAGEAPAGLGARNVALLELRGRLFGSAWPLRSECPECGSPCEFQVDCVRLASEIAPATDVLESPAGHELQVEGVLVRFRLPTVEDLRAIPEAASVETALRVLTGRCILHPCVDELSDSMRATVSQRMEALDPAASVGFDVTCAECGHQWSASVDIAHELWSELQVAAERTFLEVDALARAYGWSESQVLALTPTRRAAYLQLLGAM